MSKLLTLAEASSIVHQQYLDHLADEKRRFEKEVAEIQREEEESAWWVIDRMLTSQEGIEKLQRAIDEARQQLRNVNLDAPRIDAWGD